MLYRRIFDVAHLTHSGINSVTKLHDKSIILLAQVKSLYCYVENMVRGWDICNRNRPQILNRKNIWEKEETP